MPCIHGEPIDSGCARCAQWVEHVNANMDPGAVDDVYPAPGDSPPKFEFVQTGDTISYKVSRPELIGAYPKLPTLLVAAPLAMDLMGPEPGVQLAGTVLLPDDDGEHPYGQWSGILERTKTEKVFRLTALVKEAPFEKHTEGAVLVFYRGARKLATLFVLATTVPVD